MSSPHRIEEEIFIAVLQVSAEQRAGRLEEACGGDVKLRQRVEGLLRSHEKAGTFLENPAPGVALPPAEKPAISPGTPATIHVSLPSMEKPGDRIGRYKLLQQIGEGGCGVVYMAEQEEPVRRRVALKVIKLGMDTKNVIARFEAERQALALMDHPNIAKVFDAGATDTGRPFFVMELVRGIKITDYCDQNNLTTVERLELHIHVCQAIQHAHQKGIIHRDIKPSNILIAMHDGVPVPKVIDFGIAKATEQRLTDKTLFTMFEQFIGTPAYMSPEQAEMSALDIDTRSDIYSLGVLLYELLTSKTPFDAKELLQSGLEGMRRTIREKEPVRPSTRLHTMLDADLTTVASHRRMEPAKLPSFISDDLDWIVMKALEKDRTRRYETANGLAADIKRYLVNEPVTACPPSGLYKLRKLIFRNKAFFAAAGAVFIALVVGLGLSTYLFFQEKTANKIAVTEAKKSQQTAQFLQAMLQGVGPEMARGRDTTMLRDILDQTAARMDNELAGQPEVEAGLCLTIGQVYDDLGEYAKSVAMFNQAVILSEKSYGNSSTNTGNALQRLASVLTEDGDFPKAVATERQALTLWKRSVPANDPRTALSLNDLGYTLWQFGQLSEAEDLIRAALEMRKQLPGDHNLDVAESADNLGLVLRDRGKLVEAEAAFRDVLKYKRITDPDADILEGHYLNNLGLVLLDRGDLAGAEITYREVLTILEKVLPADHPHVLIVRSHLSDIIRRQGALNGGAHDFLEALQMTPAELPSSDSLAGLMGNSEITADALACALAEPSLTPLMTNSSADWQFTASPPGANWMSLVSTDADWSSLSSLVVPPTFAARSARSVPVLTNIWLRTTFDLTAVPSGKLVTRLNRNEDAEVFLNGVQLSPAADWSDAEILVPCSLSGQAALKPGRNLLAVHCQDVDGGTHIGLNLFLTSDPSLGRKQVIEEFDRHVLEQPQRAELYAGRASVEARLGEWPAAITDLNQVIKLKPSAIAGWSRLAPLLVQNGDLDAYQNLRRNALDRFASPDGPVVAGQVTRLCLLTPLDPAMADKVQQLAKRAEAADDVDWNLAWRQLTASLAEYRAGQFNAAIAWADKALITSGRKDIPGWTHEEERNRNCFAGLVQAMAHQQLKQTDEARSSLAAANNLINTQFPAMGSGDIGREWQDYLAVKILAREAGRLIEGREALEFNPRPSQL